MSEAFKIDGEKLERLKQAVDILGYNMGFSRGQDGYAATELLREHVDSLSQPEPKWEKLTRSTLSGCYYWTDGCGADALFCIVGPYDFRRYHRNGGSIAQSLHEPTGYVTPYVPTPGPVLEQEVQGEWPERGILTLPSGERWRATVVGGTIWYDDVDTCFDANAGELPAGYTFTPSEESP